MSYMISKAATGYYVVPEGRNDGMGNELLQPTLGDAIVMCSLLNGGNGLTAGEYEAVIGELASALLLVNQTMRDLTDHVQKSI